MIANKLFETLNEQLGQLVGEGPQKSAAELRKGVELILQSAFNRLELVTREEFDAQAEVLARTRAMVEALEARVAELEQAQERSHRKE